MVGGGFAAARPTVVKKKLVAFLLEIEATSPLTNFLLWSIVYKNVRNCLSMMDCEVNVRKTWYCRFGHFWGN